MRLGVGLGLERLAQLRLERKPCKDEKCLMGGRWMEESSFQDIFLDLCVVVLQRHVIPSNKKQILENIN